ncbi:ABC-type enterochelin transport system ATPase subunit [Massilia sp. UYP11]
MDLPIRLTVRALVAFAHYPHMQGRPSITDAARVDY